MFFLMVFTYLLGANTGFAGTVNATITPAIVGCIPDCRKKNHTNIPIPA